MNRWFAPAVALLPALPLLLLSAPADAQARKRRVTVGPQYAAGGFHRAMLGSSYRALWATPIEVEELDLAREAGGLTPQRRVGGQQTQGLALRGRDGRSYTFRGLDKDPANILPEELQDTFVEELVQDQMAAQHPAGALISDELAKAAGVPTVPIRVVVLPDDPALGSFRREFAGLAGTFSEYPTAEDARHPGFEGASEIIDHMALYAKLEASPAERVAVREYLRARLFDLLISDFDRHRKQWRWAKHAGDALWHPIPEDRDQAFARYEGLLVRAAAGYVPQIRTFGPEYDRILGLTYNGREQDRWLLPELAQAAWEEAAKELQSKITDEVIERAARRMPAEWYAIDGARLVAAMKKRRDTLPDAAKRYYRHLAGEVDVQLTNADEDVRVERLEDGGLDVTAARAEAGSRPFFKRRFEPDATKEVRLYLRGGNDRVLVDGRSRRIALRVIGGAGDDLLDDHAGGGTRYYDSEGQDRVQGGSGTHWDRGVHVPPPPRRAAPWIPPRDWGRDWFPLPWLGYGTDTGLFLGGGFTTVDYGFRRLPYASRQTLRAGWAFGAEQPRIDYEGERHLTSSRAYAGVVARYSGLEVLRYYGYGNETEPQGSDDYHKVRHKQLLLAPTFTLPVLPRLELTLAPLLRFASTEEGTRLVNVEAPYGSGEFGQLGGAVRLQFDTRKSGQSVTAGRGRATGASTSAGFPTSGVLLEATAAGFPSIWDVEHGYGWAEGSAAGYLSAGSRATLALRAGGRQMLAGGEGRTQDEVPFFDAAGLGGGSLFSGNDTVRGLWPNRFIGDRSFYANAELRLYLSRFWLALPGEWGLIGFGDTGRVWLEGESSDRWHSSWGGGLWIGLLSRSNAVAVTVAQSDERTAVYVRAGFSF